MPRGRVHHYQQYGKPWYSRLSIWARELWSGLIDWADDEGFGEADPGILRSRIFPRDDLTLEKVEELLRECVNCQPDDKMILLFEREINGKKERYYWLPNFFDFQPEPRWPRPSKVAKWLLDSGKVRSSDAAARHRQFAGKYWAHRRRKSGKTTEGEERRGGERSKRKEEKIKVVGQSRYATRGSHGYNPSPLGRSVWEVKTGKRRERCIIMQKFGFQN